MAETSEFHFHETNHCVSLRRSTTQTTRLELTLTGRDQSLQQHAQCATYRLIAGADPARGGPGGRLPLRAWLLRIYCTKMHGWAPPDSATGVYSPPQTP